MSQTPEEIPEEKTDIENEVTLPKAEYEALTGQVKELSELRDKMLRTAADFENAKKRLTRERDEIVKFGQERLLRELLPVLDNFERALAHAKEVEENSQAQGLVTGVQMVLKQFTEVLKNQGLERLEATGKIFDPNFHEAVGYVQEAGEEDTVVEELEPGYILKGRLLRAAKVRVRIAPAVHNEADPSDGEKEEEIT